MSEGLAFAVEAEMTYFREGYNYNFSTCWTKLQIIRYSEENDVFYHRIFT